jgi:hypothetical protein
VQGAVEERKQTDHPPESHQHVPSRHAPHRGQGEREDDKTQRPDTGLVGDFGERIRRQAAVDRAPDQVRERQKGNDKNSGLRHPSDRLFAAKYRHAQ